jgi:hypothetical protein
MAGNTTRERRRLAGVFRDLILPPSFANSTVVFPGR